MSRARPSASVALLVTALVCQAALITSLLDRPGADPGPTPRPEVTPDMPERPVLPASLDLALDTCLDGSRSVAAGQRVTLVIRPAAVAHPDSLGLRLVGLPAGVAIDWGDGSAAHRAWEVGDPDALAPFDHVFATPGRRVLRATVTDVYGDRQCLEAPVEVRDPAEALRVLRVLPDHVLDGSRVIDRDTGSSVDLARPGAPAAVAGQPTVLVIDDAACLARETPVAFEIDWGDGSPVSRSELPFLQHTWGRSGLLRLRLRAIDRDGAVAAERDWPLLVSVPPPTPSPTPPPTPSPTPVSTWPPALRWWMPDVAVPVTTPAPLVPGSRMGGLRAPWWMPDPWIAPPAAPVPTATPRV